MENRPKGRQTHISGEGDVHRRGEGLHTGPVGQGPRNNGPRMDRSRNERSGNQGNRKGSLIPIIIVVVLFLIFGRKLLGGGSSSSYNYDTQSSYSALSDYSASDVSDYWGNSAFFQTADNSGWSLASSGSSSAGGAQLDTTVASDARAKRTKILGSGKDQVTIMVYMCGADLESKSGMATADIQEMVAAGNSDKVNLIIYTGGAKKWKNNVVSASVNQIYQVKKGGLIPLVKDAGKKSMTDPATLTSFIKYCKENFPANRNDLILWDHGSGSISGYGYDEKYASSGSMTLTGINKALKNAGMTFDFIGFDTCLMATVENAMMLDNYADYLVASEETEPGTGWYYTDWLNALAKDPSMDTLNIGKNIVDGFVDTCAKKCRGQSATLSVTDLAELGATVPDNLTSFAKNTCEMIENDQFKTVSDARYQSREFARSSKLDQVDLVHFAKNLKTKAGEKLAESILSAVKYNRTSSDMTNAYGLSIYFPYRKTSQVDSAVKTYSNLGMDDEYSRCIQQFASMEVAGQAAGGGSNSSNPYSYLFGSSGGGYTNSNNTYTTSGSDIYTLLGALMGGRNIGIDGLDKSNTKFLKKSLDSKAAAKYISANQFDPTKLVWEKASNGQKVIRLSENQWSLVQDLALSIYYDDGQGYIDLGLDNVFEFDDEGNLIGDTNGSWLAINGQTVPYYYDSYTEDGDDYTIRGHIPVALNGEKAELLVLFSNEYPEGTIVGATSLYDTDAATVGKNMTELRDGDKIDFICDYYSYDGTYQDSYYLGEQMTVKGELKISNVSLNKNKMLPMYQFTDIYQQVYWTDVF